MKIAFQQKHINFGPKPVVKKVSDQKDVKKNMVKLSNKFGEDIYLQRPDPSPIMKKITNIMDTISLGKILNDPDSENVRSSSPLDYQKMLFMKEEREYYKKLLKQCRSKEEVKKLKEQKMTEFLMEIRSVEKSGMAPDVKETAKDFIKQRIEGIEEEHKTFTESGDYRSLPEKIKENEKERLKRQLLQRDGKSGGLPVSKKQQKDPVADAIADIAAKREAGLLADDVPAQPDRAAEAAEPGIPTQDVKQTLETGNIPDSQKPFDLKV